MSAGSPTLREQMFASLAANDVRRESCDYCDHGWASETRCDPRGFDGTLTDTRRCTACDGFGWVDIEYLPLELEDTL